MTPHSLHLAERVLAEAARRCEHERAMFPDRVAPDPVLALILACGDQASPREAYRAAYAVMRRLEVGAHPVCFRSAASWCRSRGAA